MKEYWLEYTEWLRAKLPQYHQLLNTAARIEEIEELESKLNVSLPHDLKELYLINNGDQKLTNTSVVLGSFLGFEFLSLKRIEILVKEWSEVSVDNHYGSSFPEGAIKIEYTNRKWIPLFADNAGNYIGLDFDPDNNGHLGQVINFGRDEHHKFVIAKNLTEFLQFITGRVKSGHCDKAIVEEQDGGLSYGLEPQSHLIDDLKKIYAKK